jgi:hypothetical protein
LNPGLHGHRKALLICAKQLNGRKHPDRRSSGETDHVISAAIYFQLKRYQVRGCNGYFPKYLVSKRIEETWVKSNLYGCRYENMTLIFSADKNRFCAEKEHDLLTAYESGRKAGLSMNRTITLEIMKFCLHA